MSFTDNNNNSKESISAIAEMLSLLDSILSF